MEKPTYTAIDYNSKENKAILRLTEEIWDRFFRITYQLSDGNG